MKKSIAPILMLSLLTISPSNASTPSTTPKNPTPAQVAQSIINLVKTGRTMDLKAVSGELVLPDLYGNAVYKGSDTDSRLWTYYQNDNHAHPIKSVRHTMWLDMDSGYNVITGAVEFEFKSGRCPSLDTLASLSNGRINKVKLPKSPDLITGKGGEYDWVYVDFGDKSLSVSPDGCRISKYSEAKFGAH